MKTLAEMSDYERLVFSIENDLENGFVGDTATEEIGKFSVAYIKNDEGQFVGMYWGAQVFGLNTGIATLKTWQQYLAARDFLTSYSF